MNEWAGLGESGIWIIKIEKGQADVGEAEEMQIRLGESSSNWGQDDYGGGKHDK